ncbi:MAG: cupin domain-containing protein, partial [Planctomycetota bacterium]
MDQYSRIRLDTETDGFSIPWLGDTQLRMPIRTADTAGACSTQLNTIPPGYENPPHCHGREDEVFYVIDGGVELSLGGERVRLN